MWWQRVIIWSLHEQCICSDKAQGRCSNVLEYTHHCFFSPHGKVCMTFSRSSSFDITVVVAEGHQQRIENDRFITSDVLY
jgi:hypothetical protein